MSKEKPSFISVNENADWIIPGSDVLGKKIDAFEAWIKQITIAVHDAMGDLLNSVIELVPVVGKVLKTTRLDDENNT